MNKCNQCGFENKDTSKFCIQCGSKLGNKCPECGAEVPAGASFCMHCGAGLKGAAQKGDGAQEVEQIDLFPIALGLPECKIEILVVSAEGPDTDGDIRVEVKYEITNDTDEDWEYLDVRVQLLNAAGQVVEETRDTQEQTISAGDTAEFEAGFWGIQANLLGPNPDKAHVLISITACGLSQQILDGPSTIPAASFEPATIKPAKVGDVLQVVSGSLWKTAPDDDQDSRVEARVLVQNLTANHLPLVKLQAEITDKAGREVADAGGSDEVRPGSICVLNGSGYGKDKKLAGAKTDLSIHAYCPVATGLAQTQGFSVGEQSSERAERIPQTQGEEDSVDSTQEGDEMTVSANELADAIIAEFKSDPRNKVFVSFDTLLASACEETGKKIKGDKLSKVIDDYQTGDLDDKGEEIYDGAVAIIGYVARSCFGDDPDEDIDYEIDWIQEDDSTYTAEVRPC